MRLIDADALHFKCNSSRHIQAIYGPGFYAAEFAIDEAPTIDPNDLSVVKELREKLERVTAERDAAVGDLTFAVNKYRLFTTDINLCYLCKFDFPPAGKNEQTYECPGCYGDDCFEWRGPQKEE